jgi:hypothetical protein
MQARVEVSHSQMVQLPTSNKKNKPLNVKKQPSRAGWQLAIILYHSST